MIILVFCLLILSIICRILIKWIFGSHTNIFTVKQKEITSKKNCTIDEEKLIKKTFMEQKEKIFERKWDTIVIGSGVSGLGSAGLLSKGFKEKVLVLEQHPEVIGGTTHTFTKNGFKFDTGLHMTGRWEDEQKVALKYLTDGEVDIFCKSDLHSIMQGGFDPKTAKKYDVPYNIEKKKNYLLKTFPNDKKGIIEFFKLFREAKTNSRYYFMVKSLPISIQKIAIFLFGMIGIDVMKFINITFGEELDRLFGTNEKIKTIIGINTLFLGGMPAELPFVVGFFGLSFTEALGMPINGSDMISKKMVKVISKHEGVCACNAKVSKIVTKKLKNGRYKAIGVKVQGFKEIIFANNVISSVGIENTYSKLLKNKIESDLQFEDSCHFVELFLGFAGEHDLPFMHILVDDLDDKMETIFDLENEKKFKKKKKKFWMCAANTSVNKPTWKKEFPNKTVVSIFFNVSYGWFEKWQTLKHGNRGNEYENLKNSLKEFVLEIYFKNFPQLKDHLQVAELSTPLTTEHFLGNPRGRVYGIKTTAKKLKYFNLEVPSRIDNLFLSGQDCVLSGVQSQLLSCLYTVGRLTKNNMLLWANLASRKKNMFPKIFNDGNLKNNE